MKSLRRPHFAPQRLCHTRSSSALVSDSECCGPPLVFHRQCTLEGPRLSKVRSWVESRAGRRRCTLCTQSFVWSGLYTIRHAGSPTKPSCRSQDCRHRLFLRAMPWSSLPCFNEHEGSSAPFYSWLAQLRDDPLVLVVWSELDENVVALLEPIVTITNPDVQRTFLKVGLAVLLAAASSVAMLPHGQHLVPALFWQQVEKSKKSCAPIRFTLVVMLPHPRHLLVLSLSFNSVQLVATNARRTKTRASSSAQLFDNSAAPCLLAAPSSPTSLSSRRVGVVYAI